MKYQWECNAKYKNIQANLKALNKYNSFKEKTINQKTKYKWVYPNSSLSNKMTSNLNQEILHLLTKKVVAVSIFMKKIEIQVK